MKAIGNYNIFENHVKMKKINSKNKRVLYCKFSNLNIEYSEDRNGLRQEWIKTGKEWIYG
mgnify:CR=1 FL=1